MTSFEKMSSLFFLLNLQLLPRRTSVLFPFKDQPVAALYNNLGGGINFTAC